MYMYLHMYECLCVCVCLCVYASMHVYISAYTHTHTHIHRLNSLNVELAATEKGLHMQAHAYTHTHAHKRTHTRITHAQAGLAGRAIGCNGGRGLSCDSKFLRNGLPSHVDPGSPDFQCRARTSPLCLPSSVDQ